MGQKGRSTMVGLTAVGIPPEPNVVEVTLVGPGYGECILIHPGNGSWIIVDSCLDEESRPIALAYLGNLGLDPAQAVRLIAATHWHDDHIRGMEKIVRVCDNATFCCASAFREPEFLTAVGAMAQRPMSQVGSGMQELHKVFSLLETRSSKPVFAIANRRILSQDGCEIWSLSPFDKEFAVFLQEIDRLLPKEYETKRHIPALTPNRVAVVLLIKVDDTSILLGSDLERGGWLEILAAPERPNYKASVFKIPHHGSKNAHEDRVWDEMLHCEPIAGLTPWRKAGRQLPTENDVNRILSFTRKAYTTTSLNAPFSKPVRKRKKMVNRTLRETGVRINRVAQHSGRIRFRRQVGSQTNWTIDTFPPACQLTG